MTWPVASFLSGKLPASQHSRISRAEAVLPFSASFGPGTALLIRFLYEHHCRCTEFCDLMPFMMLQTHQSAPFVRASAAVHAGIFFNM